MTETYCFRFYECGKLFVEIKKNKLQLSNICINRVNAIRNDKRLCLISPLRAWNIKLSTSDVNRNKTGNVFFKY